jgi:hypothetical protein
MIKDISNRLLRDFSTCLQQRLAAEPAGEMTPEEAVASAGAADVSGEVSGKSPAEVGGGASPARSGPAQPPAATPPVKGFSLLLSVLWERIRGLVRRGR